MKRVKDEAPLPLRFIRLACFALFCFFFIQLFLFRSSLHIEESTPSITGAAEQAVGKDIWRKSPTPAPHLEIEDNHPIRTLMRDADQDFEAFDRNRSKTFKKTVETYRRRYGRHPPPRFDEWYKFARERRVHNIDDFQQIHDDLRPFWAVKPTDLRRYAAHASEDGGHGIATISVRNGKVFEGECCGWRSKDYIHLLHRIAKFLPDMDISMNRMDQPRVVVPWDELQAALRVEETTRSLEDQNVVAHFTSGMSGFWKPKPRFPWLRHLLPIFFRQDNRVLPDSTRPQYGWFWHGNKPFMDLASQSCPPDSYARNADSPGHLEVAESSYRHAEGNFVTNANLSSDLCTVGPQLSHLHGLLYAATSMHVTRKLLPVFSECKTNVNNDVLFPASIYYKNDENYLYIDKKDLAWDDKNDIAFWRGSTSGGNAYRDRPEHWRSMHRQRLVLMMNETELQSDTASILALSDGENSNYAPYDFKPATFVAEHVDVGFTKKIACVPNCSFYDDVFVMRKWTPFSEALKYKYLIDLDGHSFSGRWRAYLQSRSLGLKATIIREWHSNRLWAWRHFVPVDNQYSDMFNLLAYFIGYKQTSTPGGAGDDFSIPQHDYEAFRLAKQGRDWANKVLRNEDIEIYLLRLLLEYGRLIDDNRDRIGYTGDGGEEMHNFDIKYPAVD